MNRRLLSLTCAIAACAVVASACSRPLPHPPTLAPTVRRPPLRAASLERRIHELINRERKARGLSRLRWNDSLSRIARNHSRDMAERGYFAHVSPDGNGFQDRYREAGYVCAIPQGLTVYAGAENIFLNNRYDSITTMNGREIVDWNTAEKIADTTVQGWMDSPGHRRNILEPVWRSEGIGVFLAPDDSIYITQNFC